jgi:hypothetical protein
VAPISILLKKMKLSPFNNITMTFPTPSSSRPNGSVIAMVDLSAPIIIRIDNFSSELLVKRVTNLDIKISQFEGHYENFNNIFHHPQDRHTATVVMWLRLLILRFKYLMRETMTELALRYLRASAPDRYFF